MSGLDLSALHPEPTADQLDRFRRGITPDRWPAAHAAVGRSRGLTVAMSLGALAAGAVLALVLSESVGTLPAVLLGLVVLVGLLLAGRLMARRLRRAQLGGWVRLDALARANHLQVHDRPTSTPVPGRVLTDPTAGLRQVLRGEQLEIGVVQHDRAGVVSRSRYVAVRADRPLPWLLLTAPGADRRDAEDERVRGDDTVLRHRERLFPAPWREQLAGCGVEGLEVVGTWAVATMPPPPRTADPGEWERVAQVLGLVLQLQERLAEVTPR